MMKVFDFRNKTLEDVPHINEGEEFELRLDCNEICMIDSIPYYCEVLILSNNKISYLSKNISAENTLRHLDISYNRLISLTNFDKFLLLRELNLSNNYIADDQLGVLKTLKNLTTLNLSNNNLTTGSVTTVLGKLNNLEKLNLASNHLQMLDFSLDYPKLSELEIDSNKLTHLSFSGNLPQLSFLSISQNKLEDIQHLDKIKSLDCLIANDNSIGCFDCDLIIKCLQMRNNVLNKFISFKLETIDLGFNNLNTLTLNEAKVKSLQLDNNKLNKINVQCGDLITLEHLDMSYNIVTDVCFLKAFRNLSYLNLSFNEIEKVEELLQMNSLAELHLIENKFNKGLYDVEVLSREAFPSIEGYFEVIGLAMEDNDQLVRYRKGIIKRLPLLRKLDFIEVTVRERNVAKSLNDSIRSARNDQLSRKESEVKMISFRNTETYKRIKMTFSKICDRKGFMQFNDFLSLMKDLKKVYSINTATIERELKKISKISLIPGKIHLNDFTSLLKSERYNEDFMKIEIPTTISSDMDKSKTMGNSSIVTCLNSIQNLVINNNNNYHLNKQIDKVDVTNIIDFDEEVVDNSSHKKLKQSNHTTISSLENQVHPYENKILHEIKSNSSKVKQNEFGNIKFNNSRTIRTPLIQKLQRRPKLDFPHGLNPLLVSQSYMEVPNLNDKNFLKMFVLFICNPQHPVKYSEFNTSKIYEIDSFSKEYQFLGNFLMHFKFHSFNLRKWYSMDYYSKIFLNYSSYDFLFENSILFFYSNYTEGIHRFIYDGIHPTQIKLYDNPTRLRQCKTIVLYTMVDNKKINLKENIHYDNKEDCFYFYAPFSVGILVPVYIISL